MFFVRERCIIPKDKASYMNSWNVVAFLLRIVMITR